MYDLLFVRAVNGGFLKIYYSHLFQRLEIRKFPRRFT